MQELAGGTPSANMLTGLGIDEVFGRTDSLGTRSFVTDALGSTVALTDGSGAIKTSYAYEPYGNATTSGEANANANQYTGRENDGTGLYYDRARYYNPGFGRFVAEDPRGLSEGSNVYSYVNGNPISLSDPSGLNANDKWYGYNDRTFQRWAHGEKQIMGRAPNENFTHEEVKDLWGQWKQLGCPTPGQR